MEARCRCHPRSRKGIRSLSRLRRLLRKALLLRTWLAGLCIAGVFLTRRVGASGGGSGLGVSTPLAAQDGKIAGVQHVLVEVCADSCFIPMTPYPIEIQSCLVARGGHVVYFQAEAALPAALSILHDWGRQIPAAWCWHTDEDQKQFHVFSFVRLCCCAVGLRPNSAETQCLFLFGLILQEFVFGKTVSQQLASVRVVGCSRSFQVSISR